MKKFLLGIILFFSAALALAQHHNRHGHHHPHPDRVLVPLIGGVLIGIAVAKSQQPDTPQNPPVYVPPVTPGPVREFYPCIIWVQDPRTGLPRQEFATCIR